MRTFSFAYSTNKKDGLFFSCMAESLSSAISLLKKHDKKANLWKLV